jgi:ferredoxin
MQYKIEVNKDECIGCGACEAQCPEGFELKDGKARAKKEKVNELGCIKEAADVCPVNAIKIEEEK